MDSIKKVLKRKLKSLIPGNPPDFIILGAQKSGTTALHKYLIQHPNLRGSRPKELHYFDIWKNHNYSVGWYEGHFFKKKIGKEIFFESSPSYLYDYHTPTRIRALYPDVKMIIILRDPITRAYSAWNMYRDMFDNNTFDPLKTEFFPGEENPIYKLFFKGRESFPSFEECIDIELQLINNKASQEPAVLRRGHYAEQIKRYFELFKKEQFLILGFNELREERENLLEKVYDFLDVRSIKNVKLASSAINKRNYNSKINSDTEKFLEDYYRLHNEELYHILGRKINW